jgi:glycosyltransferase involved in cell wall biosynthesis
MIRFIEDEERDVLFRAADLLILPYKQIFQSGVMLMAMSAGIPIIASDLEPMKELITQDKTGFLFESENESSLASMISAVINDSVLLDEVRNNAWTATEEKNSWGTIASAYISLVNE